MCRPFSPKEVWGIKIIQNWNDPPRIGHPADYFRHELCRVDPGRSTTHPIFERGELCPLTQRIGIPLRIYRTSLMRESSTAGPNEIAVKLRVDPSNGLAPARCGFFSSSLRNLYLPPWCSIQHPPTVTDGDLLITLEKYVLFAFSTFNLTHHYLSVLWFVKIGSLWQGSFSKRYTALLYILWTIPLMMWNKNRGLGGKDCWTHPFGTFLLGNIIRNSLKNLVEMLFIISLLCYALEQYFCARMLGFISS